MTNVIDLHYSKTQSINFEIDNYVYFTGSNVHMKESIVNCLNRFNTGKRLDSAEENIFGDKGIKIFYNDSQIKTKDVTIITLNSYKSILNELAIKKGTLLHNELTNMNIDLDLSIEIEKLNDQLLIVESLFSDRLAYLSIDVEYQLKELQLQDLITKNLYITYYEDNIEVPIEYRNTLKVISDFIELIQSFIDRTGKVVWIVIDQPFSFLNAHEFEVLFNKLYKIAVETKLIKLFIFNLNNSYFS